MRLLPRHSWMGVVLIGSTIVLAVVTAWTSWPYTPVMLMRLIGGCLYLVAGVVADLRRPENRTGRLLMLVAIGNFLEALAQNLSIGPDAVYLLSDLTTPLIFTLGLAFPSGRLTRSAVALVAAAWTAALAGPLVGLVVGRGGVFEVVDPAGDAAEAVVALCTIVLLVRRFRAADTPLRRALRAPYVVGLGCLLAGVALLALNEWAPQAHDVGSLTLGLFKAALPITVVVGLLGLRRDAAVGMMTAVLRADSLTELQDLVRQALHDPKAELLAAGPTRDVGPDRVVSPVRVGEVTLATLVHERIAEDPGAVRSIIAAVGLALRNRQLEEQIVSRTDELTAAAGRLVQATDLARREVERNLHDGAQQQLVTVGMRLRLLAAELELKADPDSARAVGVAAADLEDALGELRTLARGLTPGVLTRGGLVEGLRDLADRAVVATTVTVTGDPATVTALPDATAATLWYACSEALTNVGRHAAADSVLITLAVDADRVVLTIADDGVGGARIGTLGLRGLQDRAQALGGDLTVGPGRPHGTVFTLWIPR